MLSHVTLGTDDVARAGRFYDAVLAPLGLGRIESLEGAIGYARGAEATPQFWIMRPFDGGAARAGNGVTIAFEAADRAAVEAFHAAALAAGGRCEGPPGLRPHYHPDYYGAYARDPDGNKIACACHRPA
ncbi:MAG: VOC family protein [Acetobacteraceae bacterium]|nr:VOC family protein [Acetobacteraceae bacterium]